MPLLVVLLLLPLAVVLLIPFSLVQRYRVGTSRRPARGWVAALNLAAIVLSIGFFLVGAAITSVWVPKALSYSAAGVAAGAGLGALGLLLTRWERTPITLYYTPNRWLVLGITVVVSARILYGIWRVWETWRLNPDETSWVIASGVTGSLAAGGIVLGYYFVYWAGVQGRLRRHRAYSDQTRQRRTVFGATRQ